MSNKLVGTCLGLGLLMLPVFAAAQSADVSAQVQALLAQVQALEAQIAALTGGGSATSSVAYAAPAASCLNAPVSLAFGARGESVRSLQNYLIANGYLGSQFNTGYFGSLTAQAVGKFQVAMGVVAGNTDAGFGLFGPKTRAAMACHASLPAYELSASPRSGSAPLSVAFTASNTFSSNSMSAYAITYGDGTTAHVQNSSDGLVIPSHTYVTPGTYTAVLTAYPEIGGVAAGVLGTVVVTVIGPQSSGPLSISGLDAPTSLAAGESGTWTVHAQTTAGVLHYSVRWGDEATMLTTIGASAAAPVQSSATFTHSYAQAGVYQPTFTVTDDAGDSAQTSASVTVGSGASATFSAHPTSGQAPLAVTFTPDSSVGVYAVSFGDGQIASLQQGAISHTYTKAGTYSASFTSDAECFHSTPACMMPQRLYGSVMIVVTGGNAASLSADPSSGVAPLGVSFLGAGVSGGQQYIIDFGDGDNSGSLSAVDVCMHLADGSGGCPRVQTSHTYVSAGTFYARLEPYIACAWGPGIRCMIAVMPLATTKITVSGPVYTVTPNTSGTSSSQ